jgi:hypothetical protein
MPRRVIFQLLGVPFTADNRSWQFAPSKFVIGVAAALITAPAASLLLNVAVGLVYGLLLNAVLGLHIVGHILSSKLVAPPMTEARITPTLIETRYAADPPGIPARVHLVRSLGGPLMNFALGGVSLLAYRSTGGHGLLFFAVANLVIGLIVLLPFQSVDGGVIWRELPRLMRSPR